MITSVSISSHEGFQEVSHNLKQPVMALIASILFFFIHKTLTVTPFQLLINQMQAKFQSPAR